MLVCTNFDLNSTLSITPSPVSILIRHHLLHHRRRHEQAATLVQVRHDRLPSVQLLERGARKRRDSPL